MRKFTFVKFIRILLFGAIALSAVTFVVMMLWNALIPAIFGLHTISFWQALGLMVLSKILFGGFRPPAGGPRWRRRMFERWDQMTPAEREQFKQGLRRSCGGMRNPSVPNAEAQA